MSKSAQRHFIIQVGGISSPFATKTGGETTSDTSNAWDGGALAPDKLASPAVTANIVLGRPFDPERDRPVIKRLRPLVGRGRFTVTVQDTDENLVNIPGGLTTYPNALLIRVTDPEVDAASGDVAVFECEFAVESVQS